MPRKGGTVIRVDINDFAKTGARSEVFLIIGQAAMLPYVALGLLDVLCCYRVAGIELTHGQEIHTAHFFLGMARISKCFHFIMSSLEMANGSLVSKILWWEISYAWS